MQHEFVEFIPDMPEPNKLYISIEYNIAVHKCACGCGVDVVTPLSPAEWALTYDGATVSLWPSIGNWGFPCKSHYIIKHGEVRWAARFDPERIRGVRERDGRARVQQYGGAAQPFETKSDVGELKGEPAAWPAQTTMWKRLVRWILG